MRNENANRNHTAPLPLPGLLAEFFGIRSASVLRVAPVQCVLQDDGMAADHVQLTYKQSPQLSPTHTTPIPRGRTATVVGCFPSYQVQSGKESEKHGEPVTTSRVQEFVSDRQTFSSRRTLNFDRLGGEVGGWNQLSESRRLMDGSSTHAPRTITRRNVAESALKEGPKCSSL